MVEILERFILGEEEADGIIEKLDFSKFDGLIQIITQDIKNNEIVMSAFGNKEAVKKILMTGYAHYWSRSRNCLWKKGDTSGHLQIVKEIYIDCDQDAILLKVDQIEAACHTGYFSCFYRKIIDGKIEIIAEKIFEPEE